MSQTKLMFGYQGKVSPVTRYAGGKGRLLSFIHDNMPLQWNNYFEPFCGGLSVYCSLVNRYWDEKSYWISDSNADLVRVYQHIKTHPEEMYSMLNGYHNERRNHNHWHEVNFLPRRDESELELAVRYWYLIRHAFSNKSGKGKSVWLVSGTQTRSYYPPDRMKVHALNAAFVFTDTTISCCDYSSILEHVGHKDFVYLDPPYLGASHTAYHEMLDKSQQEDLAEFAKQLVGRGAYVMISNYDHEAVREMYSGFNFRTRKLRNQMTNSRGTAYYSELLAMSYT